MNQEYILPQFSLDTHDFTYTEEQFINDYAEHKDDVPWYMTLKCRQEDSVVRYKLSDYFHKTTKEDILKKLGRKKRSWLGKIAQFLDVFKYCTERNDEEVAAIPISTTSRYMKTNFGSHANSLLMLDKLQEIGLLAKVRHHWFHGANDARNEAAQYILNKEVQDMSNELIEEFGIVHKPTVKRHKVSTQEEIDKVKKIDVKFKDRIRICSSLRIADPFCCKTREEFEDLLCTILDDRYPQLVRLKQTADKINQSDFISAHPELQCRAEPSFKWSKSGLVTKIGIRATSSIASLKAHEKVNAEKTQRQMYLDATYHQKYQSYDVKASIYQITYALNTGIWLDDTKDIYEQIRGKKFKNKAERDAFKSLCMLFYFNPSDKMATKRYLSKVCSNSIKIDPWLEQNVMQMMHMFRTRMKNVLGGKTYDSEIFLYESCIYAEVNLALLKAGWKTVQIYDGFYAIHEDKTRDLHQEISSLLKKIVPEYVERYMQKDNTYKTQQAVLQASLHNANDNKTMKKNIDNKLTITDKDIQDTKDSKENNKLTAGMLENEDRCKTSIYNSENIQDTAENCIEDDCWSNRDIYQELFGIQDPYFEQQILEQNAGLTRHFSDTFWNLIQEQRNELLSRYNIQLNEIPSINSLYEFYADRHPSFDEGEFNRLARQFDYLTKEELLGIASCQTETFCHQIYDSRYQYFFYTLLNSLLQVSVDELHLPCHTLHITYR